ncbi:hypothetical protein F5X68DRAFT_276457 [Plectosphaerella plurivora]|uniref:RGS domain-containing protein n=1 Tax=Plectosphaerella plurivora TaxID=936078 RepID=A0A9P8VB08_9PEZI|nr:hypothetical protein F5X68DRAFT_276457 [Plectosphaerella plurivora]
MRLPTWLRWYKKPAYRDIKEYSSAVRSGQRSLSPDGRNAGLIPPHLSLERVLENKTCSPMSLYDFYMYLRHIEFSPENLEFYLWFKNYEARWNKHASREDIGITEEKVPPVFTTSHTNSSEEELRASEHSSSPYDMSAMELASQPVNQIIQAAIPSAACMAITRPKPTAMDRIKSFANYMSPTSAPSCQIAGLGDIGVVQGFDAREELDSVIQLYLLPSSPKELNIPPAMRDAALAALENSASTDPRHLAPIAAHVYALLRTCSHPNFLRLGVANGTLETVCVATSLGIVLTTVGFLFTFIRGFVPFTGAHSRWNLFGSWGFWFLGLSFVLSGLRGSCFFLLLFSRRQPLPWERFDDKASVSSNRSGIAKVIGRLMIFDRKMRVKDVHLRRLQRKIVLQSLLWGAIFATIGVLVFIFLPMWKETR